MMFGWIKKKLPESPGPDFSAIDSQAKAEELFRRGDLEKLLLLPEAFGGSDNPLNTLYVPLGIAAIKAEIDENVIAPLAADGTVTQYQAKPDYQGKSFIPIAITIVASNPGSFSTTVNIWGQALARERS